MGDNILIKRLGQEFEWVTRVFNPFRVIGVFLCPLKTLENLRFSSVFRGYRKRPVKFDGLKSLLTFLYLWHRINTNWHQIFRNISKHLSQNQLGLWYEISGRAFEILGRSKDWNVRSSEQVPKKLVYIFVCSN